MTTAGMTVKDLLRIVRGHGFGLVATSTELDESGADFLVAHAVDPDDDKAWIVKAPRRPDVALRADGERRALQLVSQRLATPVPQWRLFTPEVIAYPRVPGFPAAVVDEAAGDWAWRFDATAPPEAFLDSLASALAELHAIDEGDCLDAGLVSLRTQDIRTVTAERVARARETLTVPDHLWRRWHQWIEDDTSWPAHSTLVHGDLHPGHLLVDETHHLTGILDWSEAHVGDPATDFSLLYASMGRPALDALVERYERAGGRTWARMAHHVAERWCAYPAVIAEFARLTGDDQPRALAQALVDESARTIH